VAPLLLVVLLGCRGTGTTRASIVGFALLLALLLVNARLTENRIVWLAFAAVFGIAALVSALQRRALYGSLRWRYLAPFAALFVVLACAFADVVQDKAEQYYPASMSVSQVLENDPRIELWKTAIDKIRAEPWFGYGFGRGILREELPMELHNRALTHPHNTLVGQWLETGLIGLALFVAMQLALVLRYVRCIRSGDRTLGLIGMVGVALIAGLLVKNLTDDFFFRSNAKLFWALNGMLLATAVCRMREAGLAPAAAPRTLALSDAPARS
jgi:O-antigen ligase